MNWISLGDINFKIFEFYKIKNKIFSSLEFKHMIYAQAKFGGPIAITSAPDENVTGEANELAVNNICLFKNNGELLHAVPKEGMGKIVGMDFLEDEQLLLVMQDGSYVLIDPHKGTKKTASLGQKFAKDPIVEAKVIDNGLVFFTKEIDSFRFYFIRNMYNPYFYAFAHRDLRYKPSYFMPISPRSSLSDKLECLVTHHQAGIHRLIEDDDEVMTLSDPAANAPANPQATAQANTQANPQVTPQASSGLPHIKEIKMIAVSPSQDVENQMIALWTNDNTLYLVSSDLTKILLKKEQVVSETVDSKSRRRTMRLSFCGDDAVVITTSRKLYIVTKDNAYTKSYGPNTKALLPVQEIDGIKIVSNQKCELLRVLPGYYVNVFKINSRAKAKDLWEAYEDYESKEASYENNILTEKRGLQEAVEEITKAASFELTTQEQLKLLRAAHLGKTFLSPMGSTFDHNKFTMACKTLRVLTALRKEPLCRAMTAEQFNYLSEAQITRMLIRYQLYYVADEICKFLGLAPSFSLQVQVSWAFAKIESLQDAKDVTEEQQEALAATLYDKLKNESTISFAEIAKKAVDVGKFHLARKLLEKEKSYAKKIQVLLEMRDYFNSLKESITSRDPSLIDMVIFKMHREPELADQNIWSMFAKTPLSKKLLLEYIKNFNPIALDDFIVTYCSNDERAYFSIKGGYKDKDLNRRLTLLREFALKLFNDKLYQDLTRDQVEFLNLLVAKDGPKATEVSINNHLINLFNAGELEEAENIRKKFKIGDRNFYTLRAKALIDEKKWPELDAFLIEKNKKFAAVPWFCVIDMLAEAGEYDKVERYIIKLSDVDEQISILKMINRYKAAVEVAYANKKREALEEMLGMGSVDESTKDLIVQLLGSIKKKQLI